MPDSTPSLAAPRVALIGFGEAGETFARAGNWNALARNGNNYCCGWDILPERRAAMTECGVIAVDEALGAIIGADVVLSLVTADSALAAAQEYGRALDPGEIWCDMNSVSPETKRLAAEAIHKGDGRYVDVAIMAPVNPGKLLVPLLISGPAAADAERFLNELGFGNTRIVGEEVGRASAIKMIRSVMVKGIEALSAECAAAAEAAGVFDEVMASLDASEKRASWAEKVAYNRERMATHGARRAAEMEESARTLQGLGVEPVMTRGTIRLQREAAEKSKAKRNEPA